MVGWIKYALKTVPMVPGRHNFTDILVCLQLRNYVSLKIQADGSWGRTQIQGELEDVMWDATFRQMKSETEHLI